MRHARALFAMGTAAATFWLGCGLLANIPDVTLADGSVREDGAVEAGSSRCARRPDGGAREGPRMVEIVVDERRSFCIDTTEVTVAQFNAFARTGGSFAGSPPQCASARPSPPVNADPRVQDLPVTNVGACPADAYCRWAGKRLCGNIVDGGSAFGASSPMTYEWGFACVNGKQNTPYPYGVQYNPTTCNTESDGAVAVGSKAGCHGVAPPFDQIFDMTGNVREVINDFADGHDTFALLGGANKSPGAPCGLQDGVNGYIFYFDDEGFRCCGDVVP